MVSKRWMLMGVSLTMAGLMAQPAWALEITPASAAPLPGYASNNPAIATGTSVTQSPANGAGMATGGSVPSTSTPNPTGLPTAGAGPASGLVSTFRDSVIGTATESVVSTGSRLFQATTTPITQAGRATAQSISAAAQYLNENRQAIVMRSLSLLGVSYRFGGTNPDTGLDCSGLVRHVVNEAVGMMLPRRSAEISHVGQSIPMGDLVPGDLVFFNTLRRAFSHVGIYMGDGKFLHAPSSGGKVRVDQMSSQYWAARFNGARRLPMSDSPRPSASRLQDGMKEFSFREASAREQMREAATKDGKPTYIFY